MQGRADILQRSAKIKSVLDNFIPLLVERFARLRGADVCGQPS